MRSVGAFITVYAVALFLILGFWAGVGYVAYHFISKFW